MSQQELPVVTLGSLAPCEWIRFENGETGLIRDKVDHHGYRKACVEVPGSRYPNRIVSLTTLVEHIPRTAP